MRFRPDLSVQVHITFVPTIGGLITVALHHSVGDSSWSVGGSEMATEEACWCLFPLCSFLTLFPAFPSLHPFPCLLHPKSEEAQTAYVCMSQGTVAFGSGWGTVWRFTCIAYCLAWSSHWLTMLLLYFIREFIVYHTSLWSFSKIIGWICCYTLICNKITTGTGSFFRAEDVMWNPIGVKNSEPSCCSCKVIGNGPVPEYWLQNLTLDWKIASSGLTGTVLQKLLCPNENRTPKAIAIMQQKLARFVSYFRHTDNRANQRERVILIPKDAVKFYMASTVLWTFKIQRSKVSNEQVEATAEVLSCPWSLNACTKTVMDATDWWPSWWSDRTSATLQPDASWGDWYRYTRCSSTIQMW